MPVKSSNSLRTSRKLIAISICILMCLQVPQSALVSACQFNVITGELGIAHEYEDELGLTGETQDSFVVRLYDRVTVNWSVDRATTNVIEVRNSKGFIVFKDVISCSAGDQNFSFDIDPERNLFRNFQPGDNYTVQVFSYIYIWFFPILLDATEKENFRVIKAKSVFDKMEISDYLVQDNGMKQGIFVVDKSSYPIDPHYEFHYPIKLTNFHRPNMYLVQATVNLRILDANTQSMSLLHSGVTGIDGQFDFIENRTSMLSTFVVSWEFPGNDFFEGINKSDSLSPDRIFSPFDFSGPDTITDDDSDGTQWTNPTTVQTKTELRKTYIWLNKSAGLQGFSLSEASSPFYIFGSNKDCLYLGNFNYLNLNATIISPAIYYYGNEILSAQFSAHFQTVYDKNLFKDDYPQTNIFTIFALLMNYNGDVLDRVPFYSGNFTFAQTSSIEFGSSYFREPTALRIGFEIQIDSQQGFSFFDVVDEFYFCIEMIDFHVQYGSPQWGMSTAIDDWYGYSMHENTKAIDFGVRDQGTVSYLTNVPMEHSHISESVAFEPYALSSPLGDGLTPNNDIQDYSFSNNPFVGENSWGFETHDGIDFACGNTSDITNLADYFGYYSYSDPKLEFTYYSVKKYLYGTCFYSLPALRFKDNTKSKWMGISIPLKMPELSSSEYFEDLEIQLDVFTSRFWYSHTGIRYKIFLVDPDSRYEELISSDWRYSQIFPNRLSLSSLMPETGNYQLLLIVEKGDYGCYSPSIEFYFDNIEVIAKIRTLNDSLQAMALSGPNIADTQGPLTLIGHMEIPNPLNFSDTIVTGANPELALKLSTHQYIVSENDGISHFSLNLVPVLDDGSCLPGDSIFSGEIGLNHTECNDININLSKFENQSIKFFRVVIWLDIPDVSLGVGRNQDLYKILFINLHFQTNYGEILVLFDQINTQRITLDGYSFKAQSDNRNSVKLGVNSQMASNSSYASMKILSTISDARGIANTIFNGELKVSIQPYVEFPYSALATVKASVLFEVYFRDRDGNLIRQHEEEILSEFLSPSNATLLKQQEIFINLAPILSNLQASEIIAIEQFAISYKAIFETMIEGEIPECGVEIKQSSIVLRDLPPVGEWIDISNEDIIFGITPIQFKSLSHDCIGIRLLGSHDGISFKPIGETYVHDQNWVFSVDFDTRAHPNFNPDDDEFVILAQLMDEYKISNSSAINVTMDNTPPAISFGDTLVHNDTIVEPRLIEVFSNDTDIVYINLYAERYEDTLLVDQILIGTDMDGTDGWEFEFLPNSIVPGTYNFFAEAFDQTLSPEQTGICEANNILVNWIDPVFHAPTPENATKVSGTVQIDFSIGTSWIDQINIYLANTNTSSVGETGFDYFCSFDNGISDYYSFLIDTISWYGEGNYGEYFIKFEFQVSYYTEIHYYFLIVDNQAPIFAVDLDTSVKLSEETITLPFLQDFSPQERSVNVNVINKSNNLFDNFPVSLVIDGAYYRDIVSVNYTLDIFSRGAIFSRKNDYYINYTAVTEEITSGNPLFSINQGSDGYSFFLDISNGILFTLDQMSSTPGLTGNYSFNSPDEEYTYLDYIEYFKDPLNLDIKLLNGKNDARKQEIVSLFGGLYNQIMLNHFDSAYEMMLLDLKPLLTGLRTDEYEIPLDSIERITLLSIHESNLLEFNPLYDLKNYPDAYVQFTVEGIDDIGNYGCFSSPIYFVDKGESNVVIKSPAYGEQVLIPSELPTEDNYFIQFEYFSPDFDVKKATISSMVAYDNINTEPLVSTQVQYLPHNLIRLSIFLSEEELESLVYDFVENPSITWEITLEDYFGNQHSQTSEFQCVTVYDYDAPVVNEIIVPDLEYPQVWTGGFDILLNITDDLNLTDGIETSGIRFIEVWNDEFSELLEPGEIEYLMLQWEKSQNDVPQDLENIFGNFLGLVLEPEIDGYFHINPWTLSGKYSEISSGSRDFILRVFDNNWNVQVVEVEANISFPVFNIENGGDIYTIDTDHHTNFELIQFGNNIDAVRFSIYEADTILIDTKLDDDFIDGGWNATVSGLLDKHNYTLVYEIYQSDGSVISNLHEYSLTARINSALQGSPQGASICENFIPYIVKINNDVPHNFMVNLCENQVIFGNYELFTNWQGTGTVDQILVFINDQQNPNVFELEKGRTNSQVYHLIQTYSIGDGLYNISIKVYFTNGRFGSIRIVNITIDNSVPNWVGDGIQVNGVSQYLNDPEFGLPCVNTNGFLSIVVDVRDLHSQLILCSIFLIPQGGATQAISSIPLSGYVFDSEIGIDLTDSQSLGIELQNGTHQLFVRVLGESGLLQSRSFILRYNTTAPRGYFLEPADFTIYWSKTIELRFSCISSTSIIPVEKVEFFLQLDNSPNPNEEDLQKIGTGMKYYLQSLQDYTYEINFINENLHETSVLFWAKVIDEAGNIRFVPASDRSELHLYDIVIDDYEGLYHLQTGLPINGTVVNYPDYNQVTVSLSVFDGTDFITIGDQSVFAGVNGNFSINWEQGLPEDLEGGMLPITYLKYSGESTISLGVKNIAIGGYFTNVDTPQIAFITGSPARELHIFSRSDISLYSWSRVDIQGVYAPNEAIDALSWDYDGDGLDEILFLVRDRLVCYDWNGSAWVKFDHLFDEISTIFGIPIGSAIGIDVINESLVVVDHGNLYFLEFIPSGEISTINSLTGPIGQSINKLAVGNFNGENCAFILSNHKIFYYIGSKWVEIFKTEFQLLEVLEINNLDLDPENEIIFGLGSTSGIEILRGEWNVATNQWKFYFVRSYSEISRIYSLEMGHLSDTNLGQIYLAAENGLDVMSNFNEAFSTDLNTIFSDSGNTEYDLDGNYQYYEDTDNSPWEEEYGHLYTTNVDNTYDPGDSLEFQADGTKYETMGSNTLDTTPNFGGDPDSSNNLLASAHQTTGDSNSISSYRILNPYSGGTTCNLYQLSSPTAANLGYNTDGSILATSSSFTTSATRLDINSIRYDLNIQNSADEDFKDYQQVKGKIGLNFHTRSYSDTLTLRPNGDRTSGYPTGSWQDVDDNSYSTWMQTDNWGNYPVHEFYLTNVPSGIVPSGAGFKATSMTVTIYYSRQQDLLGPYYCGHPSVGYYVDSSNNHGTTSFSTTERVSGSQSGDILCGSHQYWRASKTFSLSDLSTSQINNMYLKIDPNYVTICYSRLYRVYVYVDYELYTASSNLVIDSNNCQITTNEGSSYQVPFSDFFGTSQITIPISSGSWSRSFTWSPVTNKNYDQVDININIGSYYLAVETTGNSLKCVGDYRYTSRQYWQGNDELSIYSEFSANLGSSWQDILDINQTFGLHITSRQRNIQTGTISNIGDQTQLNIILGYFSRSYICQFVNKNGYWQTFTPQKTGTTSDNNPDFEFFFEKTDLEDDIKIYWNAASGYSVRMRVIANIRLTTPSVMIRPGYSIVPQVSLIKSEMEFAINRERISYLDEIDEGNGLLTIQHHLPDSIASKPVYLTGSLESTFQLQLSWDNDFGQMYYANDIDYFTLGITVSDVSDNPVSTLHLSVQIPGNEPISGEGTVYLDNPSNVNSLFGVYLPQYLNINIRKDLDNVDQLYNPDTESKYQLTFFLWDQSDYCRYWRHDDLILTSMDTSLGSTIENEIHLFIGNQAQSNPGKLEKRFDFKVDSSEFNQAAEIVEIDFAGSISHFIWDAQTYGYSIQDEIDFFNTGDHSREDDNWYIHNNFQSLIQIWNGTHYINMRTGNNDASGEYDLKYLFDPVSRSLASYAEYVSAEDCYRFRFRFIFDQGAFVNSLYPGISANFYEINILGVQMTIVSLENNAPQKVTSLISDSVGLDIIVSPLDLNNIHVWGSLDYFISPKTKDGIPLYYQDYSIDWSAPQFTLEMQNYLDNYEIVQQKNLSYVFFDQYLQIHLSFDYYLTTQGDIQKYLLWNGTHYLIRAQLNLSYALINNENQKVVLHNHFENLQANAFGIRFACITNHIYNGNFKTITLSDADADGDDDLLLGDGYILFDFSNEVTYSMRLAAYNDSKFICEREFLATRDMGAPHPEFYGYDKDIPEFGSTAVIRFLDYSIDLQEVNVSVGYNLEGPFTTIYTTSLVENRNYFTISIDTTHVQDINFPGVFFPLEERLVYFNVSCLDDDGNFGSALLTAIVDRSSPQSTLSFDPSTSTTISDSELGITYDLISLRSDLSISVPMENTYESELVKVVVEINSEAGYLCQKDLLASRFTKDSAEYVLNLNLFTDLLDSRSGIIGKYITVDWYGYDGSGNQEAMQSILVKVDDTLQISLYDPFGGEVFGTYTALYDTTINGKVTDYFGVSLPQEFQFDLLLDGLFFGKTQTTDDEGSFQLDINGHGLYSSDIRKMVGVSTSGYGGDFYQKYPINMDYDYTERELQADGNQRFFIQNNDYNLDLVYENIDLSSMDYENGFEGFHLDIFIPNVYDLETGSTYSEIQIQFNATEQGNPDAQEEFFYYSISASKIVELMLQNLHPYIWKDMYVSLLSVDIPLYELNSSSVQFNISKIHTIRVVGRDNSIHPDLNFDDWTHSYQALICGGIYLLDELNNASLYWDQNTLGINRVYAISGILHDSIENDVVLNSGNSLAIGHRSTTIDVEVGIIGELMYNNRIWVEGISFGTNDPFAVKGMIMETFTLKAFTDAAHTTIKTIAAAFPVGISSEKEFLIVAHPGTYYDLFLEYSGNSIFQSCSEELILGSFSVNRIPVILDLWNESRIIQPVIELDRNQTCLLTGQVIDINSFPILDIDSNFITITQFWHYLEGGWYEEGTTSSLPLDRVLVGLYDQAGNHIWFNQSTVENAFFSISLENTIEGNFPVPSGDYICILYYTGNEFYEAITRFITVSVKPTDVVMKYKEEPTADYEVVEGQVDSIITYTDDKTYSFELMDAYNGDILSNVPVWIQIGIVPNCRYPDRLAAKLANCSGDYLIDKDSNAPLHLTYPQYTQPSDQKPIFYPYLDELEGEYAVFAPLFYEMKMTSENGTVDFVVDGEFQRDILSKWEIIFGYLPSSGIPRIQLYFRAFYAKTFNPNFMKLSPQAFYGEAYDVNFLNNQNYVYDESDETVSLLGHTLYDGYYLDPYHSSKWVQGIISFEKEDTLLVSAYQEITGPDEFYLYTQVYEADEVDGQLIPENREVTNFIEHQGLHAEDEFTVKIEIFDHLGENLIVPSRYSHTDPISGQDVYIDYTQRADEDGVVTFNCSGGILRNYWDRLVPNLYSVHYDVVTDSIYSYSPYYELPGPGQALMLLKSVNTYSIDTPSHIYSLSDELTSNFEVNVSHTDSISGLTTIGDLESNFPTLTADIEVKNLSILPDNYNLTDEIEIEFYLNDLLFSRKKVSNYSDPQETNIHVEIPLLSFEDVTPSLEILVNYKPNPNLNVNWTHVYDLFSTYTGELNWSEFSAPYIENTWKEYEIMSDYEVVVSNLYISDSLVRGSPQCVSLLSALPEQWIQLDGSETMLSSPVSEVGIDGIATNPDNSFITDLVDTWLEENLWKTTIDRDSVVWTPNTPQIVEEMQLNSTLSFDHLFLIEQMNWNHSLSYLDNSEHLHNSVYQAIDGYQLGSVQGGINDWRHSLRAINYYQILDEEIIDIRDGLQIGLNPNESIQIEIPKLYIPFQGFWNWSLFLPKLNGLGDTPFEIEIQLDLAETYSLNPTEVTKKWVLTESSYAGDNPNELIYDNMAFAFPTDLQSKFVSITITFTAVSLSNFVLLEVIDGLITGNENFIKMSNVYPTALRARMFSTNFLYYFTRNGFSFGATQTDDGGIPNRVNDVYYEITDGNDPEAGNLKDITDMWDWTVYSNPPDGNSQKYVALENWVYNSTTGTYNELEELFHENDNKGTFFEFGEGDTQGLSMAKIKFNETYMADVLEPARFSGFVNLYDVIQDTISIPGDSPESFRLLATRKVTVLVNPEQWTIQPEYSQLNASTSGTPSLIRTSNLDEFGVIFSELDEYSEQAILTYQMEPSASDIAIKDWTTYIKLPGAPTPPTTFPDNFFYDLQYYSSYYDLITGDSNWNSDASVLDSYVNVEISKSSAVNSIYQFSFSLEELYSLDGKLDHYDWLDIPFFVDNTSYINQINIAIDNNAMNPVVLGQFYPNSTNSQFMPEDVQFEIDSYNVEDVVFQIYLNNSIPQLHHPNMTILGLGLYEDTSLASLNLTLEDKSNNLEIESFDIFPSLINDLKYPKSKFWNLSLQEGSTYDLKEILLESPSFSSGSISLMSLSVISNPIIEEFIEGAEEEEVQVHFGYSFDESMNALKSRLYGAFDLDFEEIGWIVSDTLLFTHKPMIWTEQKNLDFDGDGNFDVIIQLFDGEGKGHEIDTRFTGVEPVSYFENGIKDSTLYDFNADGTWDFQEKWDLQYYTVNSSEENSFGTDYHYITQKRLQYYEYYQDLTGDGIFNLMERTYSSTSLREPIPNYREYYIDSDGVLKNSFEEHQAGLLWNAPISGILRQYDLDGNGVWELVEQWEDRFQNSPEDIEYSDIDRIYESHTTWSIDENGNINRTDENYLQEQLEFILLGPDDISSWDSGNGDYEHVISGDFIVIRGIPVIIDSRHSRGTEGMTEENGTAAWYDSDGDGYYEIAFIFTEQSWQEKIAVAVYQSKSGQQKIFADFDQFKLSNDVLVTALWLSDYYSYPDIFDVGWDQAKSDYHDQLASQDFWIMWATDTIMTALIMFTVALAPVTGGASLLLTTALFLGYQYLLRPALEDVYQELGWIERDRSHELGGHDTSGFNSDFWAEVGQNLSDDFLSFGFGDAIPMYEERAYFTDVNPFYQDLNPSQFDPVNYPDDLHEDYSVYIPYQVPELWSPTADNFLADFDLLQAVQNSGGLRGDLNPVLANLGIEKGVPSYFTAALQYFQDHPEELDGLTPLEQFGLFQSKMLELQATHRRVLHQFLYRDAPWGNRDLWNESDPSTSGYSTEDEIGTNEAWLSSDSAAKFQYLSFTVNEKGQPMLTASYKPDMNYSDPICYEIDYLQMCLISRYRTGYESAQKYDLEIFWTNLLLEAIQTAIAIAAGYAGGAVRLSRSEGMSFGQAFKQVWSKQGGFLGFLKEIGEEMILEKAISTGLQMVGVSPGLADQLGEILAMDSIIDGIRNPKKTVNSIKQFAKKMKVMNQFLFGTDSMPLNTEASVDSEHQRHSISDGSPRISLITRIRQAYISFKAASLVDMSSITILQERMAKSESVERSGSTHNQQHNLDVFKKILGLDALKYPNLRIPKSAFTKMVKSKMLNAFIENGGDAAAIINDAELWRYGGLGLGKDGNFRFQFLEFKKKLPDGSFRIVEIHPDGNVKIQEGEIVSEQQLDEFMHDEGFSNLCEIIAGYDSVNLIDPIVITPQSRLNWNRLGYLRTQDQRIIIRDDLSLEDHLRSLGAVLPAQPTDLDIVNAIRQVEGWGGEGNVAFIRFKLWDSNLNQFIEGFVYAHSQGNPLQTPEVLRPYSKARGSQDPMTHTEAKMLEVLISYFGPNGLNRAGCSISLFTELPPCYSCHNIILQFLPGGVYHNPNLRFEYPHWNHALYQITWVANSRRYLYTDPAGNVYDFDSPKRVFDFFGIPHTVQNPNSAVLQWVANWP